MRNRARVPEPCTSHSNGNAEPAYLRAGPFPTCHLPAPPSHLCLLSAHTAAPHVHCFLCVPLLLIPVLCSRLAPCPWRPLHPILLPALHFGANQLPSNSFPSLRFSKHLGVEREFRSERDLSFRHGHLCLILRI